MQIQKRKIVDEESSAKKKKVHFNDAKPQKNGKNNKKNVSNKIDGKTVKDFKKDDPKSLNTKNYNIDKTKKFSKNKTLNQNKKTGFKNVKKFNITDKANAGKNSKPSESEKPKWSEMKKEKKTLRIERRKAKSSAEIFELSHKAKLLSAQIQRKVVKQEFRLNACKELHILIKGQYKSIALTHDLSRVIQVLLKHSPEDIKNEITEELLDLMVPMMQSKYAHHSVKRVMKYGTDFIRHEVIKKLFGHIVSLASHTISAPVLDYTYGEFANKKEKLHMQQEFYGDMYKNSKDDKVKTLSDTYKDSPEMKGAILQSCKANIQRILDKNLHDSELLHTVLYDYIRECSQEDREELISTLCPLIVPLSNSLPGVNTSSICVWQGTNKDKKAILKVVKEHVVPLSKHKTGYRLLITIFDSVDDTVLVKKAIVSLLANNLKDIAKDHWGNMVLHWLVKPRDSGAFHPTFIKHLEDGAKSGTSKKDTDLRVSELRESILPALKKDLESDPEFWLSNKTNMLLAVAVLSIETSKDIMQALANVICQSDWKVTVNDKEISAIEDAGIHMCLKKLAALDKSSSNTLGECICEVLSDDTLNVWLPTNRGCFFILKLIENNKENIVNKLKKKIKLNLQILKQNTSEGAKLLKQCVQN